ncbi:MAG: SdpI family protein [Kordiimonas sp.]
MIAKHQASWVITALTIVSGIVALVLADSDAAVPIHWNAAGEVDGTTSPLTGFLMMPGIQVFTILLLSNLHLIEPRKEHLEKSEGLIFLVTLGCALLFAAIQGQIIAVSFGYAGNSSIIFVGVGILLALIGNYMGKLQSTFTVGIRTPWTLSSEQVWRKTHRLGGKLMLLAGTIVAVCGLIASPEVQTWVMLITILPAAIVPIIYSWILWRKEQTQ